MGKAGNLRSSLAFAAALAAQVLTLSVNADLSANEVSIDAIRAAEERVAEEHGMTIEELRSKIANECFERVRERDFEGSEGGIFAAKDARYNAEYGCANLAIVGPSAIENSQ